MYSLSKLNYHVTSKTHTREEQLKRAMKRDNVFPVFCPDCQYPFASSRDMIKHIKEFHPEQLWNDFDVVDEENNGDDDGEDDEDDDFAAVTVPYIGKGKARAD